MPFYSNIGSQYCSYDEGPQLRVYPPPHTTFPHLEREREERERERERERLIYFMPCVLCTNTQVEKNLK
jgi:hypothetical protein